MVAGVLAVVVLLGIESAAERLVVALLQDRAKRRALRRLHGAGQRGAPPVDPALRRQPALRLELRPGRRGRRRRAHHRRRRRQRRVAALQHGATHVDAVEIDRKLYELGRADHPDQPYADERVDVHIDDGRALPSAATRSGTASCWPCPTRSPSSPARRRCAWRATCSPRRPSSRPATTWPRAACSRCTTTTARAGWSTATPARSTRPSARRPASRPSPRRRGRRVAPGRPHRVRGPRCDPLRRPRQALWSGPPTPSPSHDDHPFPYLRSRSMPGTSSPSA